MLSHDSSYHDKIYFEYFLSIVYKMNSVIGQDTQGLYGRMVAKVH